MEFVHSDGSFLRVRSFNSIGRTDNVPSELVHHVVKRHADVVVLCQAANQVDAQHFGGLRQHL